MRFASLGSGSRGNAALVQAGETCVLLDCGFSVRELENRCRQLEVDPAAIDAVLVTHEHGDHIKGVGALARKYGMPVWMTHGTWRNGSCGNIPQLRLFSAHSPCFAIGGLEIMPYAVPHDAREPSQFTFQHGSLRLGVLTDCGSLTPRMVEALAGVDALLLECNHDPVMLANGPYPPRLQARVGGDFGHLSNAQAAQLLSCIDHHRLQHLLLAHLSEKNNHPELAAAAICAVDSDLAQRLTLLQQARCSAWFELR